MVQFVGPFHGDVDVVGLLGAELGELGADLLEVKAGHHLVEVLGQHVDLLVVLRTLGEQFDLGEHLVGEGIAHHEAGVAGTTAQVHQSALGQQQQAVATGQDDVIHLGFDVVPGVLLQGSHIDFVVEVTDVADDRLILHLDQVLVADHLEVAGGGHEDVHILHHIVEANDAVALHGGLQGADRIDLGNHHGGAEAAQGLGRTLADVAVTEHQSLLTRHHYIGGALDAVHQRFAATIEVVELALGDGIVDVDRREGQFAALLELVETGHAGGGFLGHALDVGMDAGVEAGLHGQLGADRLEQGDLFFTTGVVEHREILLGLGAKNDEAGGITAVVKDHVGRAAIAPLQDAVGEGPVFIKGFALVGEDGDAGGGDGSRSVVLGGEDVA